jgi:hypothetical protein
MDSKKPEYQYKNHENIFRKLIDGTVNIRQFYYKKIFHSYDSQEDRISYVDIAELGNLVVKKLKKNHTSEFEQFFNNIESIFIDCDKEASNLLVAGLFESLQKSDIDYYNSFNQWLKPNSKTKWDGIIDFWEGKDWRTTKEKRESRKKEIDKILKNKK